MNYWIFFVLPLLISVSTIFADTTEYEMDNPSSYKLEIEKQAYPIPYQVDANVIAMAIDTESTSLLIGLGNAQDSEFIIELNHEIINAQNDEFVILVNGIETEYQINSNQDSSTVAFFVPVDTEEVEIIGTHVVPEFPVGVITVFTVMVLVVTVFAKIKTSFFKL